jgi:N-acetylneuraminic acid mutarotase
MSDNQSKAFKLKLLMVICLCIQFGTNGQQIKWTKKASIPISIGQCGAAVAYGKIYLIGGRSQSFSGDFGKMNYEYNPKTDFWTKKQDMPTGRTNFAIAVVDNKIYVIGGDPFSDKAEVYDPKSDIWKSVANMPTKRQHVKCAVVDNKIYVVGGLENVSCPPYPERCNYVTSTKISTKCEVYDPAKDSWQELKPISMPRHGNTVASCNGKIYSIGGMGDSTSMWTSINLVDEFDPKTNNWVTKRGMPFPSDGFGVLVQKDMIITTLSLVYDVKKDTWYKTTALPVKRHSFAYVTIGNKFYVIGGEDDNYKQYSDVYEGTITH